MDLKQDMCKSTSISISLISSEVLTKILRYNTTLQHFKVISLAKGNFISKKLHIFQREIPFQMKNTIKSSGFMLEKSWDTKYVYVLSQA